MKRIILLIMILFLMNGCMISQDELLESLVTPIPTSDGFASPHLSTPTPTPTPTIQPVIYHSDAPVEEVITYFNEVCLDAEFVNSGDPSKIQKWNSPIYYVVLGDTTEQDREMLSSFVSFLNSIYGFPGMFETDEFYEANLRIHFTDQDSMAGLMGEQYRGMDGCVTFWYDADIIYDGVICYRTDLDQTVRNSVILEEIYNCLGPIQDTSLRDDSIIYAGYSTPQALTEMDELILRLLYNPQIQCGMNAEECERVIRALYK